MSDYQDDEDRILAEAQAKLERNRELYRGSGAFARPLPLRETTPELVPFAPADTPDLRPDQLSSAAAAGRAILQRLSTPRPATGKARAYTSPPPPTKPRRALVEHLVRQNVPEAFRGITWETLAEVINPDKKGPSLGTVVMDLDGWRDRPLTGREAAHELFDRLTLAPKVVLFGETRAGKTLVSVAALDGELQMGNERARWVHAPTLQEPDVMARALSSSFLVLDDLGYELNGETGNSPWLPRLRAPACKFLGEWYLRSNYLRSNRRLIVTTFLNHANMVELYGAGPAARVYEGALVIKMERSRAGHAAPT